MSETPIRHLAEAKHELFYTEKSDRPRPRREEPPPEDTRPPISVTEAPF